MTGRLDPGDCKKGASLTGDGVYPTGARNAANGAFTTSPNRSANEYRRKCARNAPSAADRRRSVYGEDPQSQVDVSTQGFDRLGQAGGVIGLPTLVVQEGGYHLPALAQNAAAFFCALTSLYQPAG